MHPKALVGMTIGAAIMFLLGILWFFTGLAGGRFSPTWIRILMPGAGVALAVWISVLAVRAARVLSNAPPLTPEQAAIGRNIGRRLGLINAIQGAAIVAAIVACNALHRVDCIAPVIAVIVGLHFLPLASILQIPVYYATGLLGCAIGGTSLLISDPAARLTAVGLSFGLLLWLTVTAVLLKAFSFGTR